jgi:hypothetical protein
LGFALCCKLSNSILVSFSRFGFINLKQGIRAFRLKKKPNPSRRSSDDPFFPGAIWWLIRPGAVVAGESPAWIS